MSYDLHKTPQNSRKHKNTSPLVDTQQVKKQNTEPEETMSDLAEIKKMFAEIQQGQISMQQGQISMNEKLTAIADKILTIETDVRTLQSKQDILAAEMNDYQQSKLVKCFVIAGLPPSTNVAAIAIIQRLAQLSGVITEITEADFKRLRMVDSKRGDSSLIFGELWEERLKSQLMRAFRAKIKTAPIVSEQLFEGTIPVGFRGKPIFFRGQNTPETVGLAKLAKTYRGSLFEHTWIDAVGRVLAKTFQAHPNFKAKTFNLRSPTHLAEVVHTLGGR